LFLFLFVWLIHHFGPEALDMMISHSLIGITSLLHKANHGLVAVLVKPIEVVVFYHYKIV
jgi:hypothetical protein